MQKKYEQYTKDFLFAIKKSNLNYINQNTEQKWFEVKDIDYFKYNLNFNEIAFFNSIIYTIDESDLVDVKKYLILTSIKIGCKDAVVSMFDLFNNSRSTLNNDFEYIFKNSVKIERQTSIRTKINEICAAKHIIAHREAMDYITKIFFNCGLMDRLIEMDCKND